MCFAFMASSYKMCTTEGKETENKLNHKLIWNSNVAMRITLS